MRKPRRGVPAGRYVSHFAQFQRISRKLYVDGAMARRLGRYSIVSVSGGDPPPALPVPPSSGGGTGAGLIHRVTYPPCYMQAYAAADKILRLTGFRSPEGTGSRSSPPLPAWKKVNSHTPRRNRSPKPRLRFRCYMRLVAFSSWTMRLRSLSTVVFWWVRNRGREDRAAGSYVSFLLTVGPRLR